MWMTLPTLNKRQRIVTFPAMLLLLNVQEKEDDVLEMTDGAALMYLSEEVKPEMEELNEAMNLVSYIYKAFFAPLKSSTKSVVPES